MPNLKTERLTVVSFTLPLVEAALSDKAELERLLGARVPADWPGPDYAEILPMTLERRKKNPAGAVWSGLILHTADNCVIGDIGFKGGPDQEETAEIGYSIIPAYRRQGYAYEAARAMINWACQQPGVKQVVADCLVDNIASIGVLTKLGMEQVGREMSDEGELIKWRMKAQ